MNRQETIEGIRKAIAKRIPERIEADKSFADQGWDSLDHVEAFFEVEDQFGINIPDEDTEKLNDLDSLASYVEGKLRQQQRLADAQSGKRIIK